MAQFARPDSDITTLWTPTPSGTHYTTVDEAVADDGDYVSCSPAQTDRFGLSNVTDPAVGTGHIIRYRARATGGGGPEKLTVRLFDGGTQIHITQNITITRGSFNDYSLALATAEADAIINYNNLEIQIQDSALGTGETIDVSQIYLEVPDAGATLLEVQDAALALSVESPTLTQNYVLVVAEAILSLGAESAALVQHNVLAVAEALLSLAAETPTLTAHEPGASLVVQDALLSLSADGPALTQHNALAVADALISLAADSPALTQHAVLAVADALLALAASSPSLTQHYTLEVADATLSLGAENIVLEVAGTLAVQEATIALSVDNVSLVQHGILVVQDAALSVAADGVVLLTPVALIVQGAVLSLAADSVAIFTGPQLGSVTMSSTARGQVALEDAVAHPLEIEVVALASIVIEEVTK